MAIASKLLLSSSPKPGNHIGNIENFVQMFLSL
jgi:hypothetical protein